MADYVAGTEVKDLKIVNLYDVEDEAREIIPEAGYGYIRSGAGDEFTLRRNITCFNSKGILPRVIGDVEHPDTSTTFLGKDYSAPFFYAPIAALGIAHEEKEIGMAKAFNEFGTAFSISSYAGSSWDEMAPSYEGYEDRPRYFQLYMSKNHGFNEAMLNEAKDFGCQAIILTADSTVEGNRELNKRNHFTYPFGMPIVERYLAGSGEGMALKDVYASSKQKISPKDIEYIKSICDLPVMLKGVQTPEDALKGIGAGADVIYVSNHGGRQLDGAPGSFETLEAIAQAVQGEVPIVFDSGIRRGEHVFKALAAGADVVGIGRPALYGLALGGHKGVLSVLNYLKDDLTRIMQLTGCQTIEDIKNARLTDLPAYNEAELRHHGY
ncbi:alpha-hydroxy-acid oxidizing protein [Aerococcus urinae]|uniref:L-lactate oxidase n=2 Tax=Aerococcus mictus TaxID=2976810 RepID=A0A1E9PFP0_9LACT|nr:MULTISPECIES: alpha-hydroxy-acid oxidizing protein [Aerococcus]KAA9292162.1 lactate oxidase [Aerococcus mictus]MBU5609523.1 alpha-hydroxy-acid oxidizing protein [Aerococcus urinae]MCY3033541.1 alpha-hydroxy-acid oxidizing protein [Aerococcus mictus]MCY3062830.1 alpha-hydroxy-acid oxidizing protein [Aerococcus mictus]MCY3065344.1 alpha-hydroxy-acid oxidizing protein [Aerococcus mictus]